jgi:hypothetical protein
VAITADETASMITPAAGVNGNMRRLYRRVSTERGFDAPFQFAV